MVYLDHWALRDISESPILANRFRTALLKRGGSLAISLLNIIEFARPTAESAPIPRHVALAEMFLDSLMPHIYLIQICAPWVIRAETAKYYAPGTVLNPADSDDDLVRIVTMNAARNFGMPISFRGGIASVAQNCASHQKGFKDGARTFVQQLYTVQFPNFAKATPKQMEDMLWQHPSKTYCFMAAVYQLLYTQRATPLKDRSVMDLWHMIVPVSHCNYVLLDGNTCHIVSAVKQRYKKLAGDSVRFIAKVYSKPMLDQFFADFENPDAAAA
jgi:hypothetical protein